MVLGTYLFYSLYNLPSFLLNTKYCLQLSSYAVAGLRNRIWRWPYENPSYINAANDSAVLWVCPVVAIKNTCLRELRAESDVCTLSLVVSWWDKPTRQAFSSTRTFPSSLIETVCPAVAITRLTQSLLSPYCKRIRAEKQQYRIARWGIKKVPIDIPVICVHCWFHRFAVKQTGSDNGELNQYARQRLWRSHRPYRKIPVWRDAYLFYSIFMIRPYCDGFEFIFVSSALKISSFVLHSKQ